jgi:hypothetical protein
MKKWELPAAGCTRVRSLLANEAECSSQNIADEKVALLTRTPECDSKYIQQELSMLQREKLVPLSFPRHCQQGSTRLAFVRTARSSALSRHRRNPHVYSFKPYDCIYKACPK